MEARQIIADSSVWVAYFYDKDSQHTRAVQVLEEESLPILVPEYILLETVTILRQKKEELALQKFMLAAMRDDVYLRARNLGIEVARLYATPEYKKLSFVDVSLVLLSKEYRVITFDRALQNVINKEP